MRPRIALVDYGAGNIRSVAKALERSELTPVVTADPKVVEAADGVLLPGVGAFRDAVCSLTDAGLAEAIRKVTDHGRPYLGICFGLQLLYEEGDEHGRTKGLGVFRGRVTRFPDAVPETGAGGAPAAGGARMRPLRVPHIGWNEVRYAGSHPMLAGLPERDVYYFVHSYRPEPTDLDTVVGWADYGGRFAAAVAKDNVFAVQFHPEKSQAAGKRLLDAYRRWLEAC
ncbi:MAG: imidazole glycerol phosphate synthase subunit HisH [Myxococcota bacterium]